MYSLKLVTALFLGSSVAFCNWPKGAQPFASAKMDPRSGSEVTGTVDFAKQGDKLLVKVYLAKLSPGAHAFHVHEKGDCSASDGSSAGPHFNPGHDKHGGPDVQERHIGDLGNITAKADGSVSTTLQIPNRKDKPFNWEEIVGKGLIVHAAKDDFKTQPSGNAGDRIACGVIRSAK